MRELFYIIDSTQRIAGVCPCCGEIFQLSEAKFIFPRKNPPKSELSAIYKQMKETDVMEEILYRREVRLERFNERVEGEYQDLRDIALEKGRRSAKRKLKKMDSHFSGRGFDPQDVKIIFDPVEFVIFNRLNDGLNPVDKVIFYGDEPKSRRQENVMKSIESILEKGAFEFSVLRISDSGELLEI